MQAKLVQLVHIGKSQLRMDEETYRSLLAQQFGKHSSKALSETELKKLISILQQKGAKIKLPQGQTMLTPLQRKLWAVWKTTAETPTNEALSEYAARMGFNVAWHQLTNPQAVSVLETLKQWQKRVGK